MSDVFNKPIIMIMYVAGSGGTFMLSLLQTAIDSFLPNQDLCLTDDGEYNQYQNLKNFGLIGEANPTILREQLLMSPLIQYFNIDNLSDDDHVLLMRDRVKSYVTESPSMLDAPMWVSMSHYYNRIPIYKKVFRNIKIVNISFASIDDYMIAEINSFRKFQLSTKTIDLTLQSPDERSINEHQLAIELAARNLKFALLRNKLTGGNNVLLDTQLRDLSRQETKDALIYQQFSPITQFQINCKQQFEDIQHLVAKSGCDAVIPFNCFRSKDVDCFTSAILNILPSLNRSQCEFIERNFINYCNKQDARLMTDPLAYYYDLKAKTTLYLNSVEGM